MRDFYATKAELERAKRERQRLETEANDLRERARSDPSAGLDERLGNLQRGIDKLDLRVAELRGETGEALGEMVDSGRLGIEGGDGMMFVEGSSGKARSTGGGQELHPLRIAGEAGGDVRSAALRANERAAFLPEPAREHMERQLRQDDDPDNSLARYTAALSDRAYFRAFCSWVNDPATGGHSWTPDERQAVSRVREVQRSMKLSPASTGGALVLPYELDPGVVITASYRDPLREIARVDTTVLNAKRYVTSAGVTSSWDAEEVEVSDDSPTLAEVTITTKKAMTFVPVSFELYEDSAIAEEVARLFADSKAAHESLSFTLTQAGGPVGVVSAIVAAGGASVLATGTNVLGAVDVYSNQAALPARWRSNAKFMAHQAIINGYRQLPVGTNVQESLVQGGDSPRLLDWPVYENSNMDGVLTGAAADYTLLSGDFNQYVILDRLGAVLEFVPQLFGAAFRPTGQRGFLQHWRVGADVLVPGAFVLTNHST